MGDELLGIDLQIGPVELMAGIKTEMAELRSDLKKFLIAQYEYQLRGPVYVPIGGSATSPSSGSFSIDLGGPAPLRRWEVRQLVVGGLLFSSTVAGSAVLYQGPVNQNATEPSLSNVEDQTATLPKISFYSAGQVIVRHPNRLFLFISSPTAATAYTAGGVALDSPDVALKSRYSE